MGRKSNLTDEQWETIRQRLLKGETSRAIAEDYPQISASSIRGKFGKQSNIAVHSNQVKETAQKIADAQLALQAVPPVNRPAALDLAASLQSISASLARTAELSSRTAHRLASLANSEASKVDDADPMSEGNKNLKSLNALKSVSTLTKMAKDASSIGLNLLNANKDRLPQGPGEEAPTVDASKLSNAALLELVNARAPAQ
jgi:hypothetical protein